MWLPFLQQYQETKIFRSGLSLSFPVELTGGRFYFHCVFKNEILILGNEKASSKGTAVNFFLSFVLCVKEMIFLSPLCHHHLLEFKWVVYREGEAVR